MKYAIPHQVETESVLGNFRRSFDRVALLETDKQYIGPVLECCHLPRGSQFISTICSLWIVVILLLFLFTHRLNWFVQWKWPHTETKKKIVVKIQVTDILMKCQTAIHETSECSKHVINCVQYSGILYEYLKLYSTKIFLKHTDKQVL